MTEQTVRTQSTQIAPTDRSHQAAAVVKKVADDAQFLYEAKTMFPFDLFPTRIIVDKAKVSIVNSLFFLSKEVQSLPIKDIFNVTVDSGPLFAQVTIAERMAGHAPVIVRKLPVQAAFKLRRIIQGLIIATNQNLDLQSLSVSEQLSQIETLGSTSA
jgi:hypothetical protein